MNTIELNNRGISLIELIMAIVIGGIIFLSVSLTYKQIYESIADNIIISRAVKLSEREFSIIYNIPYGDITLANGYNHITNNYGNSGLNLRRTVSYEAGTDVSAQSMKRIAVTIYKTGSSEVFMRLVTIRTKNVRFGK